MRIAICDDNSRDRAALARAIVACDAACEPEQFEKGAALLRAAQEGLRFSIAFLDIYMPGENGVEMAKRLQELSPETGLVFITTSTQHAVDAYAVGAVHYLVKPVTVERVREALHRVSRIHMTGRHTLALRAEHSTQLLYQDEIALITSSNHTCQLTRTDGTTLQVHMALSSLAGALDRNFIQLQRGVVVNMAYIQQMQHDRCLLRNGQRFLLSRRERAAINAAYNNYVFEKLSDASFGREVQREGETTP